MAVSELGNAAEIEGWELVKEPPRLRRVCKTIVSFAHKKPLGFICGLIVLAFVIIGDLIPETLNKISSIAGWGTPVPYIADQIDKAFGFIQPYSAGTLRSRLQAPSPAHLLGTDSIGRDILSRLLYGARTAVIVSIGAVAISETIAATIGIVSGYYGGLFDKLAYRVVDVFQALPGLVILITVLGIFGSGLWQLVFVIGFIGGPPGSRVIRGQTIHIMASPYIEAARVIGASDRRIMFRYVLPNVFALIILGATLRLGGVVLLEASLSFLGYGVPPPFPSWGQTLSEGREYMRTAPGLAIWPGLAIALLVFSFNLFGDALRDTLDPRLRGSS